MQTLPIIDIGRGEFDTFDAAAGREWLVTNGIGGFAAGTVGGATTRRYHGLLVASLKPPVERVVMVAKVDVAVDYRGVRYELGTNEYADNTVNPHGYASLQSFRLEGQMPVWTYTIGDAVVEQRVWMVQGENTTHVELTLVRASASAAVTLVPLCAYRDYHSHGRGHGWLPGSQAIAGGFEIRAWDGAVPYYVTADRGDVTPAAGWHWNVRHRAESRRGLDDVEDYFEPGRIAATLEVGESLALTLSTEAPRMPARSVTSAAEIERQQALLAAWPTGTPEWIRTLALAADQFVVARGTEGDRSVIAGYPWFSDWGRDTMMALPGLAIASERFDDAARVLRTFGRFVSDGMLPNRFPDAGEIPEYNTVDATLWFFHAIDQYLRTSGDQSVVRDLYPVLNDIIDWHLKGTRYGIHVDSDGLLYAGEPGVQLTWMDAKVGDWVVTPRIGKPVEINALWYHALVVMRSFASELRDRTAERRFGALAGRVLGSFRTRFWNEAAGCLYDVVDAPAGNGNVFDDASVRPNQVFAVSVNGELLEPNEARAVVDVCAARLWTPVGLRSLEPSDPNYRRHYRGGPLERDGAYHQGTVWSWLLGPFALAHYRVYGDAPAALAWLDGIRAHLAHGAVGTVSEIFDAEPPHLPEGCFAQAWSIAEVLRAYHEITLDAAAGSRVTDGVTSR